MLWQRLAEVLNYLPSQKVLRTAGKFLNMSGKFDFV